MSPAKRFWIRFWYNTATRLLLVIIPGYFVVLIPALWFAGLRGEALRETIVLIYGIVFGWAVLDNDFSNLRRIGLDEYHRPLKHADDGPDAALGGNQA